MNSISIPHVHRRHERPSAPSAAVGRAEAIALAVGSQVVRSAAPRLRLVVPPPGVVLVYRLQRLAQQRAAERRARERRRRLARVAAVAGLAAALAGARAVVARR